MAAGQWCYTQRNSLFRANHTRRKGLRNWEIIGTGKVAQRQSACLAYADPQLYEKRKETTGFKWHWTEEASNQRNKVAPFTKKGQQIYSGPWNMSYWQRIWYYIHIIGNWLSPLNSQVCTTQLITSTLSRLIWLDCTLKLLIRPPSLLTPEAKGTHFTGIYFKLGAQMKDSITNISQDKTFRNVSQLPIISLDFILASEQLTTLVETTLRTTPTQEQFK